MDKKLTLNKREALTWSITNKKQYATEMLWDAIVDYLGGRCLALNGLLFPGFGLMSQSIEKLLKCAIFLDISKKAPTKPVSVAHNPFELKKLLPKNNQYGLDAFDNELKNLYGHFQQRYSSNIDKSNGANSGELKNFDEIWMRIWENLSIPDEVKYRTGEFLPIVFEEDTERAEFSKFYSFWIEKQNGAFSKRREKIEKRYKEVMNHLYPKRN